MLKPEVLKLAAPRASIATPALLADRPNSPSVMPTDMPPPETEADTSLAAMTKALLSIDTPMLAASEMVSRLPVKPPESTRYSPRAPSSPKMWPPPTSTGVAERSSTWSACTPGDTSPVAQLREKSSAVPLELSDRSPSTAEALPMEPSAISQPCVTLASVGITYSKPRSTFDSVMPRADGSDRSRPRLPLAPVTDSFQKSASIALPVFGSTTDLASSKPKVKVPSTESWLPRLMPPVKVWGVMSLK